MDEAPRSASSYLDYLQIEMTIMGLLSAFCVAVLGWVADQFLPDPGGLYIFAGCIGLLVAALLFYRQRSLLAYYHGQISLALSSQTRDLSVDDLIDEADCWATWIPYRQAFIVLFFAFGQLILAHMKPLTPVADNWAGMIVIVSSALAATLCIGAWFTLRRFRYRQYPWLCLLVSAPRSHRPNDAWTALRRLVR